MKRVSFLSLVLLSSLLFSAGCRSTAPRDAARTSRNTVRNQSGQLRHPYEMSKKVNQFSVTLTFHVSEGSFLYSLADPQGTPMWQGRVDAGQNMNETRSFKPMPGKWLLTMSMENVTGNYEIEWKGE